MPGSQSLGRKRKKILKEGLDKLRTTLYNFYGYLNEITEGVKPTEVVEKPEALVLYEQIKSTGLFLYAGGLLEQPYIFMMEYAVCSEVTSVFDAMRKKKENTGKGNQNVANQ